jgi:uncharacterized damage-inducible protein DinB
MKTTDFIRMAMERSANTALALVEDMRDAPLTFPTAQGGNHPLWILGHIAVAEGKVIQEIMLGGTNPLAHWMGLFGFGSQPVAEAARYPSFDQVLQSFQEVRAQSLQALDSLTDNDLEKPSKACPPQFKPFVGTIGQCLQQIILHPMYHAGQASDARRMAGRKPLFG